MSVEAFLRLLRDTYDRPQEVARGILALRLPARLALMVLALVAVLTTLLAAILEQARMRMPAPEPLPPLFDQPLALAVFVFLGMLLGAVLIHRVGRLFGGKGSWEQTLSLVAWLQVVFTVLQVVQLLLQLVLPILNLPVLLFSLFSVVFLTAQFASALHGFTSLGKVIGVMVLTVFLLSFLLTMVFVAIFPVPHV